MNRSFASWLTQSPGGAVFATGLLGLLPLFGLGFAFFLPGAVPALVSLVRGPRLGMAVALGATVLLTLAMWTIGRPVPVGLIYSAWVLGPPLALAAVLARTRSLSMCLQLAVLAGVVLLVFLHVKLGDPAKFWAPFVRDLAEEMQKRGLPMDLEKDGLAETLARTLWGWVTALTILLAMCAIFLARWWQTRLLPQDAGRFGAEFQQLRLGVVLGDGRRGAHLRVAVHRPGAGGRHGADFSRRADAGRTGRGAPVQGRGPVERRVARGDIRPAGAGGADHGRRDGGMGIRGQLAALATVGAECLKP